MRMFAAIDLSDDTRAAIAEEQAALVSSLGDGAHGLKVVRPEQLHLTLAFAGNAPDDIAAALVERMQADIDQAPFVLVFGGIGFFPSRGAPRIVWLGVIEGAGAAAALHAAVASRFAAAGAQLDSRPFRPHLTLGRWRHTGGTSRPRPRNTNRRVAALEVASVTLYQSRLSSSGPAYAELAHSRLTCRSSPSRPPTPSGPFPLR